MRNQGEKTGLCHNCVIFSVLFLTSSKNNKNGKLGGGEKFQYKLQSQKESHLHVDDNCSRNPFHLFLLSISSYSYHDNIPTIYFCMFQPVIDCSFLNLFWMNLHVNYLLSVIFLSLRFVSLLSFLLFSFGFFFYYFSHPLSL